MIKFALNTINIFLAYAITKSIAKNYLVKEVIKTVK